MALAHACVTWKSSSESSSSTIVFLPLPPFPSDFSVFLVAGEAFAAFAVAGFAAPGFDGDLRLVPIDAALLLADLEAETSLSAKCLLRFTGKASSSCVKSSTSCSRQNYMLDTLSC